jgi:hypothetical protein
MILDVALAFAALLGYHWLWNRIRRGGIEMRTGNTCSWCHHMNWSDSARWPLCENCGHRADLPRQECDCNVCVAVESGRVQAHQEWAVRHPGLLLLLCLILSGMLMPSSEAKPRWKDARWWAVTALAIGSTTFQVKAAHDCRQRNDVSVCFGGYGSPKAMSGLIIVTSAGMWSLSNWTRGDGEHSSSWTIPSIGTSAFNLASGIKQTRASKPKGVE